MILTRIASLAVGWILLAGCDQKPSIPADATPAEKAPAGKLPSTESCLHWLDNNDVRIALPGLPAPWKFVRGEVSDLKVLWLRENPADPRKPLLATLSFRVTTGGRAFTVRGTIGYRQSVQFEHMLVYEDWVTDAVE